MKQNSLSKAVLERLPVYLQYLRSLPANAPENISATTIANELGLGRFKYEKTLHQYAIWVDLELDIWYLA